MAKATFAAIALAVLLPIGVSAQGHSHGAHAQGVDTLQPAAAPGMMLQMQERMGGMQQMMQSMQERMQTMQERMQGMQQTMQQMHGQRDGMRPQGAACVTRNLGLGEDPGLSEEQRIELGAILERARSEALATLTDEQRVRLAASDVHPMLC